MAAAAHLTRLSARLSTNTRVKFAQQYAQNDDRAMTMGAADDRDFGSLSRLQFDGYDWEVIDEADVEALQRRFTRKLTMKTAAEGVDAESSQQQDADLFLRNEAFEKIQSDETAAAKPTILARFDTNARMLMSPSRNHLLLTSSQDMSESSFSTPSRSTTTPATMPSPPRKLAREKVPLARATPKLSEAPSTPPPPPPPANSSPQPVTPILTTRRFRDGRSSFLCRPAAGMMAE
jgi:hypothetical protein